MLALNKPNEAIEILKPFTERASQLHETPLIALAIAYLQAKDIEKTKATYDFIWNRFPDKVPSWEARAWNNLLKANPDLTAKDKDYFPFCTAMVTEKWDLKKMPLKVCIINDTVGTSEENQAKYRATVIRSF